MEAVAAGRPAVGFVTTIHRLLSSMFHPGFERQKTDDRGMFVSEISAASVQQIYEFRALIDGHAARLAATRAAG